MFTVMALKSAAKHLPKLMGSVSRGGDEPLNSKPKPLQP